MEIATHYRMIPERLNPMRTWGEYYGRLEKLGLNPQPSVAHSKSDDDELKKVHGNLKVSWERMNKEVVVFEAKGE